MKMGTEQLCIKWSDYQSNLTSIFEKLFSTESLVDVTLACEGLSLNAHKIVLSASSPYFQTLFLKNPCKHPIVIMQGTKYAELKAIIDFMYKGEINIPHHQLPSILKTAEVLSVKGLIDAAKEINNQPTSLDTKTPSPTTIPKNIPRIVDISSLNASYPLSTNDQTNLSYDSNNIEEIPSEIIETAETIKDTTTQIINESLIDTKAQTDNSSIDISSQTSAVTINELYVDISLCSPSEIKISSPNTAFESSCQRKKNNSDAALSYSESNSFLDTSITDVSSEPIAKVESTSESMTTFVEESPLNNISQSLIDKGKNKMIKISSDNAEQSKLKQCKSPVIIKDVMQHITENTVLVPSVDIAHKIHCSPYIKKEIEDPPSSPNYSVIEEIMIEKKPVDLCKGSYLPQNENSGEGKGIKTMERNENIFNHEGNVSMKFINDTTKFQCDVCQKKFPYRSLLRNHMVIHTGERTYKCDECKRSFSRKTSLICHLRTHRGGKTFQFNISKQSFLMKHNLKTHYHIHSTEKLFKCDICNQSFRNKNTLTNHIRTHTGEKPFQCHICKQSFIRKQSLLMHICTHTGEKPFKCDICKQAFTHRGNLTRHIHSHTGENPFSCDICKQTFRQKGNLIRHIRIHRGEKPFKCNICKQTFTRQGNLMSHIRTHTGEKPFQCDTCKQNFREKEHLIKHFRTHTGEKPFQCEICKQSFTQKSNLVCHLRIHTGEKPFYCDICKQNFGRQSTLISHFRTHTGEKCFQCNTCKQSFRKKDHLVKHFRIHTGEKPFQCEICKQSFRQKSNMVRHLRIHSGKKAVKV